MSTGFSHSPLGILHFRTTRLSPASRHLLPAPDVSLPSSSCSKHLGPEDLEASCHGSKCSQAKIVQAVGAGAQAQGWGLVMT